MQVLIGIINCLQLALFKYVLGYHAATIRAEQAEAERDALAGVLKEMLERMAELTATLEVLANGGNDGRTVEG